MPRPADDNDLVTSLVDLADASQALAVDQFRLLRLETVDEVRRTTMLLASALSLALIVAFGVALIVSGAVVGLSPVVGWAGALVAVGIVTVLLGGGAAWFASRATRPSWPAEEDGA